ncbi:hypothetical protein BLA29_002640 [Euroglyphus maynei]|uniref:Uncharacterized protein n=1 Tax=Euroglyphus maynei TaxID=6958 RepID=A0A1Y3BTG3_EURMA|nr:hypothetical protein BLA29_002640 [Euroglyphus maynei]
MTNLDEYQIRKYLEENVTFSRDWFVENASSDIIREWFNNRRKSTVSNEQKNGWLMENLSQLSNQLSTSREQAEDHSSITKELLDDILDKDLRKSVSSNQIRVTTTEKRSKLVGLSEEQLLVKLLVDITSELDVDILCHKILTNVSLLINCDRASLFLVKGNRTNRYLVAKLFDVTPGSLFKDALVLSDNKNRSKVPPIPFGII